MCWKIMEASIKRILHLDLIKENKNGQKFDYQGFDNKGIKSAWLTFSLT